MELIDSHCHLDVAAFDSDRDEVLARCRQRGVQGIVVPAIQRSGWAGLLRLCRQQAGLYPALGLHPVFVARHSTADLAALETSLTDAGEIVAVGEIGLDFYLKDLPREAQIDLFEAQLAMARAADLPVILHVRKSHEQVLQALKRERVKGGIVHAFNGSSELARQYHELGFKLGFGGSLTYPRARKLRGLAASLPLSWMVLETDAPDMSGEAYHGQRNSPAYLPDYLAVLAGLREESMLEIARVTRANTRAVLALPDTKIG